MPLGYMTMSIHKLTAGSGYDYLTRRVAALDATEKGHVALASYYMERGETPGLWVGAGLAGIDGLDAGDAVTAELMRALFGAGMHPLATQWLEQLRDADLTEANVRASTRLGCRSRSPTFNRAAFGLRWRSGSRRSRRGPGYLWTGPSRPPSGQEFGPRWRRSGSPRSMAGHQPMPGRSPGRSRSIPVRRRRRSPASI